MLGGGQNGLELIPAGSIVHGTIEEAVPASEEVSRGRITFAFAVVQHATTRSRAAIRTRSVTFEAQDPEKASDSGRRSEREPNDVVLPAGHRLVLTLAEPLLVLIPTTPPAAR